MLQYATKKDLKEAACIEFRRKNEEERKRRIFNPRTRLIGVDLEALDKQVVEKESQRQHEANIQRQYDNELDARNHQLSLQLQALAAERHKLQCEINGFRANFQRREQTREFDLNDPQYLRNGLSGRDPITGAPVRFAHSLTFAGEDEHYEERHRQQKEQQRAWLRQQMAEKNRMKSDMEKANQALNAAIKANDERIRQIDEQEQKLRREFKQNTVQFNHQLSREQQAARDQRKREDDEDDMAQIINMMTSDMLTENKSVGRTSNWGPGRLVVSQYRGLTDEEMMEIRNEQKQQIQEKIERENSGKQIEQEFDRVLMSHVERTNEQESELNRQRQEIADQIKYENEQLAVGQRLVQNVSYKSEPNEKYFLQFNTTTR